MIRNFNRNCDEACWPEFLGCKLRCWRGLVSRGYPDMSGLVFPPASTLKNNK